MSMRVICEPAAMVLMCGSSPGSKRYQLPGIVPSRARAMTFICIQLISASVMLSLPTQTVRTSSSSGTPRAQNKTFERAQLDTISNQPTVGKAHRA